MRWMGIMAFAVLMFGCVRIGTYGATDFVSAESIGDRHVEMGGRSSSSEYFPPEAEEAIKRSQGWLVVESSLVGGGSREYWSHAILMEGGIVVALGDYLPADLDLYKEARVYFSSPDFAPVAGFPMAMFGSVGFMMFQIKEVPLGMRPVAIRSDVAVGEEVFAAILGGRYDVAERSFQIYKEFFFRAKVIGKTSLVLPVLQGRRNVGLEAFYVDREISGDLSRGSLIVDRDGKAAGMVRPVKNGPPAVMNFTSLDLLATAVREVEDIKVKNGLPSAGDELLIKEAKQGLHKIAHLFLKTALDRPGEISECLYEMLNARRSGRCRDQHARYENPLLMSINEADNQGEFGGIGIVLKLHNDLILVAKVLEDSPASRAGIKEDDQLVVVDGYAVQSLGEAAGRVRGGVGEAVEIVVRRSEADEPVTIRLIREIVTVPSVSSGIHPDHPDIGLVKIKTFTALTPEELERHIDGLLGRGAFSLVIDVRDNPGGPFFAALEIVSFFMKDTDIALVQRYRNKEVVFDKTRIEEAIAGFYDRMKKQRPVTRFGKFEGLNVAVLINKGSASGSEIVAGSLQQFGYPVIGTPSFGKGVMQGGFDLPAGRFFLTISEFFAGASRVQINGKGVLPDVVVEQPPDEARDLQLEKAIEVLKQKHAAVRP